MSAEMGFVCGAVGEFVGAAADRGVRMGGGHWLDSVPVRVESRRVPWWRRARRRVIVVRPDTTAVRGVRRALCLACQAWGVAELGECVAACASELVTNAIVHAVWPTDADRRLHVVVSRSARAMVVEVCDPDPRWPTPRAVVDWDTVDWGDGGAVGESGLGLRLVRERVTELGGELGCVSGARGKSVFFALPLAQRGFRGAAVRSGGAAR